MISHRALGLIAASGLSIAALSQNAAAPSPIPSDPLELVTSQVRIAKAPAKRASLRRLLGRARDNYVLRNMGRAYDLKVSFTVNSGGQTNYDGSWTMEEIFDPNQGLRWTANAAGSYFITRISSHGMLYGDETANYVPLRLQEARAALFDPIPSLRYINRAAIRTSPAVFNGTPLTCILLSSSRNAATRIPGRRWDETEECIDPQSGLLQVHSQVPGRYYSYDYANAPRLGRHILPRRVTITEAGHVVTEISVDSFTELPAADPNLFIATEQMKARGRAIEMTGAQKIVRAASPGPYPPGATADMVCVFGVVTPSGQLAEAHSLQPSDPNSRAAVETAEQMSFSPPLSPGAPPRQHFVFVIEKFVSPE